MTALVFVYIMEVVSLAHAQNTPLEWFLSTPGLGVVLRLLLSEICWLHIRCPFQHRTGRLVSGTLLSSVTSGVHIEFVSGICIHFEACEKVSSDIRFDTA